MNIFSILTDRNTAIELSEDNYYNATHRVSPYVQQRNGKNNAYALCPECENPVQLINRTNKETEANTLYAKHVAYKVEGIAEYSDENYTNCSLANPQRFDSNARRTSTAKNNEIKQLVIDYIDTIIYTIERDIKITFTDDCIKKAITDFALDKGYEYKAINPYNLPYGFIYRTEALDLYGCTVKNKEIAKHINEKSEVFSVNSYGYVRRKAGSHSRKGPLNQIRLFFSEHTPHDDAVGEKKESIKMNIVEIDKSSGVNASKELHFDTIFLDKVRFLNDIRKRERLRKFVHNALN
ncbi:MULTISPECIES: hypothetical protein [Pseudomonas syringae group]|uniref:Uncharacterized protein n=2 Tax=Pseudomonas syringae group TaxID=136849 RepID=A0A0P9ML01_PSESX|nr:MULTISPECIES: hypothetical protein [Pseudomonas syringae group]KPW92688.1 hypothetical protein ALO79_200139 [Pseudomonas syringae pv. castaneae]KWS90107.1 hypothetical protein AL048_08240 [Pseudomonas syringae pv. castaneae]RMS87729.1 hypothetical protein ALP58_200077 [Pseudomonas savastanoi]GKQ32348.1 hypothetical protein PSTH68_22535 [Pseudomonas syringae pv. theae]